MNKNFFGLTFLMVLFSFLTMTAVASAASLSLEIKPYLVTVKLLGASPSQNITIYVTNDSNLNKDSYSESKSILTDDAGEASAEFIVSPNKAYRAYTSLSNTPSELFTTPRISNSTQVKISSFGPKTGPVGTDITIVGDNFNNHTEVLLGSKTAVPVTSDNRMMTIRVPNEAKSGRIVIKTKDNGTATSDSDFEVTKSSPQDNNKVDPGADGALNNSPSNNKFTFSGLVPKCNTGEIDKVKVKDGGTGQYIVPCDFNYFMALINRLIKFFLFDIATPFLAIIIIYVAYLFLTSGGSNQVEKAKSVLLHVVVGYVIALAAWLIINTIISALGVTTDIDTFMDRVELPK